MRALVTGAAGFIGSNLVDSLLASDWDVCGVDRFTAYYEESAKRANLAAAMSHPRFALVEADLLHTDLGPLVADADVIFHLAGQPGVRLSWSDGFQMYNDLNVNVTQRLLEECRRHPALQRLVFASSSSVYGQAPNYPTSEDDHTRPHSPYGITKLAAEMLCSAYGSNFGVPTVSLRYFTVYGPRQRPDMAIHRMIESARHGVPFPLFGDGSAIRDFTFVEDIVNATMAAALTDDVAAGTVLNIAGGASTTVAALLEIVADAVGRPVPLDRRDAQPGDVTQTGGSIDRASDVLGWKPGVSLDVGVRRQFAWHARSSR